MIGNELKVYDGLTSKQQLNLFRNLYYNDGNATEYGIIANAINDCFTADVVPKSEVEALEREIERLKKSMLPSYCQAVSEEEALKIGKQYGIAEVAREIFEEIGKKVKASITIYLEEINKEHIKDTPLYDRHSGIIFALQFIEDFIAELKKKYTEEKK